MASGGIYDHLGGGFARYATDRRWLVPHFEKMLYDNALLARLYLHAWQVTGEARYRQVVDETLGYLLGAAHAPARRPASLGRGRRQRGGGGRFYVWTARRGRRPWAAPAARRLVRGDRGGQLGGPQHPVPAAAAATCTARPRSRRPAGRSSRPATRRVRPGLDDKVLTEWNAMAVAALAEAGAALGRADWVDAAAEVGRVPAGRAAPPTTAAGCGPWQAGRARHLAYAADYAWLVEAFTRLAEATGQARVDRPRPGRRRTSCSGCSGTTPTAGVPHHRRRRRGAHRPAQGHLRRGHAVGQLGGRRRPAPPRRP